jgi:hypothetical protein
MSDVDCWKQHLAIGMLQIRRKRMREIRWIDKVYLVNNRDIQAIKHIQDDKPHALTEEQLQNLKDDGLFKDIESEKDESFWETFYED